MTFNNKSHLLTYLIASVWLINGLFCKVLNLVPRHQEIVARILGDEHSRLLTVIIGLAEIAMAIWIISRKWSRVNAVMQILIILTMNTIEFILAPDLLLWGKFNALFAFLFVILIGLNEFVIQTKQAQKT